MDNKVKFGLKNVHVFPITAMSDSAVTYGEVIKIPGAVALSLSANGESEDFFADDNVYFSTFANSGYEGDLEIALIPDEFYTKILGQLKDTNGAIVEGVDDRTSNYAMAFEFDGDQKQVRHVLYNCTSSRPSLEGETVQDKKSPKTEKISIKAAARPDIRKIKAKLAQGMTGYDTFYDAPYTPVE